MQKQKTLPIQTRPRHQRGATRNPDLLGAAKIGGVSTSSAYRFLEGRARSLPFVEKLKKAGHPLAAKALAAYQGKP